VSGQLCAPATLTQRKQPPVPTKLEAGWGPQQVWVIWWKGGGGIAFAGNQLSVLPLFSQDSVGGTGTALGAGRSGDEITIDARAFQARSQNCEKRQLASSCKSLHLSAWNNSAPTR
jgi:hypothetical protein